MRSSPGQTSAPAPQSLGRSAACLACAADRSSYGRPVAGAIATACPASPADAYAAPSAAPWPTPTRSHDQPTTTAADPPDGAGRRSHAAARGSPVPSRHRYEPTETASRPPGRRSNTSNAASRPSRMPDPSHPLDHLLSPQVTTSRPSNDTLQAQRPGWQADRTRGDTPLRLPYRHRTDRLNLARMTATEVRTASHSRGAVPIPPRHVQRSAPSQHRVGNSWETTGSDEHSAINAQRERTHRGGPRFTHLTCGSAT